MYILIADTFQVAAVLLFGDVRHVAGQSYNVLSGADDNSYSPRPSDNLAKLNNFESVMRSYCDSQDPICAEGDTTSVHLSYFELYSEAAASWVRSMVGISATAQATATLVADSPATSSVAAVGSSTSAVSGTPTSSAVSSGPSASITTTGSSVVTAETSVSTSASSLATATATATAATDAPDSAAVGARSVGAGTEACVAGLVGLLTIWLAF